MEGGEGKQRWISTVINNSARAAAAAVSACACVLLCCLKDVSLSPSPLPPPGHSAQFVSGGIKKICGEILCSKLQSFAVAGACCQVYK